MLTALTERGRIAAAQHQLEEAFTEGSLILEREVRFQGGNVTVTIHWHAALGIWGSLNAQPISSDEKGWSRFWNAFGVEDPTSTRSGLSITCEANPAHEGVDLRVAGIFARGDDNHTYLLHTGRIGGGRKGVGQKLFWQHWPYRAASVGWERRVFDCAVVADLESPQACYEIARFVKEVQRIKTLA